MQITKEGEHVTFKNYERKTNSAFMIYAGFESILAVENNGKQNPDKFYTNKYQKNSACNKSFKSYVREDDVYNFVNDMIEESNYCTDIMKKHFNKELVMTEKDNEDFKSSTKRFIFDDDYLEGNVKLRDHCHITRQFRGFPHRDCNTNIKLSHKIAIVFHNLKNYDSHHYARTRQIQLLKKCHTERISRIHDF